MPDGRRRSREGWADSMEDGPPGGPAHVHRLPKAMRLAVVGLSAAVFLLLIAVGLMAVYVYQQQLYIQGRGEFRDAEAARMEADSEERTRQAMCDLLDTFPADVPGLERARTKYQCGPGIPRALLTPEEQSRIQPRAATPPPAASPPPALSDGAVQGASPQQSGPPPRPQVAPPSPTAAEPTPVDLGPVTDLICTVPLLCD